MQQCEGNKDVEGSGFSFFKSYFYKPRPSTPHPTWHHYVTNGYSHGGYESGPQSANTYNELVDSIISSYHVPRSRSFQIMRMNSN